MNPLAEQQLPSELGDFASIAKWRAQTKPADSDDSIMVITTDSPQLRVTAAAVCAVVLGKDAATITAAEFDDEGRLNHGAWMTNCGQTRDLRYQLGTEEFEATELLPKLPESFRVCVEQIRELPGRELPALLDGPVPAAALLVAYQLAPEVLNWVRPLQLGTTPTETFTWEHLRIDPILPFKTRLNDGCLTQLATEVLRTAVSLAEASTGWPGQTRSPIDEDPHPQTEA